MNWVPVRLFVAGKTLGRCQICSFPFFTSTQQSIWRWGLLETQLLAYRNAFFKTASLGIFWLFLDTNHLRTTSSTSLRLHSLKSYLFKDFSVLFKDCSNTEQNIFCSMMFLGIPYVITMQLSKFFKTCYFSTKLLTTSFHLIDILLCQYRGKGRIFT